MFKGEDIEEEKYREGDESDKPGAEEISVRAFGRERGGAAEEAGLRQGDVIISANLTPVEKLEDLSSIVRRDGKARGAVMLQVNRRGQTTFVTVNLEKK